MIIIILKLISDNIILYWNIDILQHKYKKYSNKVNDLIKLILHNINIILIGII